MPVPQASIGHRILLVEKIITNPKTHCVINIPSHKTPKYGIIRYKSTYNASNLLKQDVETSTFCREDYCIHVRWWKSGRNIYPDKTHFFTIRAWN